MIHQNVIIRSLLSFFATPIKQEVESTQKKKIETTTKLKNTYINTNKQ